MSLTYIDKTGETHNLTFYPEKNMYFYEKVYLQNVITLNGPQQRRGLRKVFVSKSIAETGQLAERNQQTITDEIRETVHTMRAEHKKIVDIMALTGLSRWHIMKILANSLVSQ